MYFAYSWPRVLSTSSGTGRFLSLHLDHTYFIAVSEWSVQVWSGGQVRLRLGQHMLSQQEVQQYGQHVGACWCPERSSLAVLTSKGWLLLYSLHVSREPVLPHSSSHWSGAEQLQALRAVDVYIKHPLRCEHSAPPSCLACDSQSILVAYADGFLGSASWLGKMRSELCDLLSDAAEQQPQPGQELLQQQLQAADSQAGLLQQQQQLELPDCGVEHMHYCETSRLLAVVFADGSAALYSPGHAGALPTAQLDFRRWLCGPAARATRVQVGPQAHLIALGTATGAVHLLRLHPPAPSPADPAAVPAGTPAAALARTSSSSLSAAAAAAAVAEIRRQSSGGLPRVSQALPADLLVRSLELHDWGHTPQQTGGVASLAWAPDCRALAVGFSRQGLVLWTPSGCRLLCTLRQPAPETPRASALSGKPADELQGNPADATASAAAADSNSSSSLPGEQQQQQGQQQQQQVSVDGAVDCLAWGFNGYQLMLANRLPASTGSSSSSLCELSLAKSLRHHHRVSHAVPAGGGAAAGLGVAQLGEELHVLQAADRLLLVTEALTGSGPGSSFAAAGSMAGHDPSDSAAGSGSDLHVHHVPLPAAYLAANWPVQHVAVSACGADIAAAGRQGLALFNRRQEKWRLFGDVSQERRVSCVGLGWLSGFVAACSCSPLTGSSDATSSTAAAAAAASAAAAAAAVAAAAGSGVDLSRGLGAGFKCQLLLFPRSHLDLSAVVASYTLNKVPLAMDCTEQCILIASAPLQLLVLQLEGLPAAAAAGGSASLLPAGRSSAGLAAGSGQRRLVAVRELSMFNVGRPVQDMALVSPAAADMAKRVLRGYDSLRPSTAGGSNSRGSGSSSSSPCHAVLLRWGGLMSVLDLARGAELVLADEVESFWLSDTLAVSAAGPSSSRAGSASASAPQSRSSSMHNLSGLTSSSEAGTAAAAAAGGVPEAAACGLAAAWEAATSSSVEGGPTGGSEAALLCGSAPEVVEMPWWAYGPIGMQLWFPSLVLAAMAQPHASSSAGQLRNQASLPAALSPHCQHMRLSSTGSGSLTPRASGVTPRVSSLVLAASGGGAAAAAGGAFGAAGTPGSSSSRRSGVPPLSPLSAAGNNIKHAQSAPMLAGEHQQQLLQLQQLRQLQQQQLLAASAAPAALLLDDAAAIASSSGGGPPSSTEIELEFDREVYPIGVSLADASIVGVTQRVLRPAVGAGLLQPSSPQRRSSTGAADVKQQQQLGARALPLPCFLPVPESQPVLPALLRRLLQQGALPEALALATRHEGGPHFRRSLEWLLFTTLDMEAGKCKPLATAKQGGTSSSSAAGSSWVQHAVPGAAAVAGVHPAAFSGVLGRQGKGWQGHPERHLLPVPVTPLLSSAVELVLCFSPQCWDVVVSVSRKTDAALWPALFSAVGSPAALLELLLEGGALSSAACFLIVVDRLEGAALAQSYGLSLIATALKRGQFFLVAEILRFLIPPRESSSGLVQWGPAGPPTPLAAAAAEAPGAATTQQQQQRLQKQPSADKTAAAAAGSSSGGWFGWLWGSGGSSSSSGSNAGQAQQRQHAQGSGPGGSPKASAGSLSAASQYRQSLAGGLAHANGDWHGLSGSGSAAGGGAAAADGGGGFAPGADACRVVAEKGWSLLGQGKLCQLVQLVHSMSFLTGGLAGIMAAYRPTPAAAAQQTTSGGSTMSKSAMLEAAATPHAAAAAAAAAPAPLGVESLMSAVVVAVDELPVWESPEVEQDAGTLLQLVKALALERWCIALAVLLVDTTVLAPFAGAHPALWASFCQQLQEQPDLYFLHEVVGALAAAGQQLAAEADKALQQQLPQPWHEAAAAGGPGGDAQVLLLEGGGLTVRTGREGGSPQGRGSSNSSRGTTV